MSNKKNYVKQKKIMSSKKDICCHCLLRQAKAYSNYEDYI